MCTTNFAEVTGFMRLGQDSPLPEIQYQFVVALAMDHGRDVYAKHRHVHPCAAAAPQKPVAACRLPVRAGKMRRHRLRYFSHPDDLATMVAGVRRVLQVYDTPTLKSRVKADLRTANCRTDGLRPVLPQRRRRQLPPHQQFHIGPDVATSVVDARLCVHGLQGLRVIDSSHLPPFPVATPPRPAAWWRQEEARPCCKRTGHQWHPRMPHRKPRNEPHTLA